MSDIAISAAFPSRAHAESAAAKLRALRVDPVQIIGSDDRLTMVVAEEIHPQTIRVIEQCGGLH
ncbi:MAG: hypothetical protein K0R67_812 [Paenibacillus sp.]|jgi:hypothetical protein|nr:hypothetical protein [Paenibacillus sp.]